MDNWYVWFQRAHIFLKVTVVMVLTVEEREGIFLFMKSCCHTSIKLKIRE